MSLLLCTAFYKFVYRTHILEVSNLALLCFLLRCSLEFFPNRFKVVLIHLV